MLAIGAASVRAVPNSAENRAPDRGNDLVPKGGLEPPRDNSHTPLKRTCLPFHHFGSGEDRQESRLPDTEL